MKSTPKMTFESVSLGPIPSSKNRPVQFRRLKSEVRVFDGRADVLAGDRKVTVKGGYGLALNTAGKFKAQGFDKKAVAEGDDLYRWSSLRSSICLKQT